MMDLEWLEPESVVEATQLLSQWGDQGKLIAGGTWVTLVLKQKLLIPAAIISLQRVPGLNEIRYTAGQGMQIGALVNHRQMELSPVVRQHYPVLADTYSEVANVRVRYQATVGGNLCDADYASDPPATLAALNAKVHATSTSGERTIPVRDFIVGHYSTVLKTDELVTHISIPELPAHSFGQYIKYRTRSHEDRPCLGVAVVAHFFADGRCRDLNVVVGAVGGTPRWVEAGVSQARGQHLTQELAAEIAEIYAREIDPLADLRASSWYRKEMIRVFVRRGIEAVAFQARQAGIGR